MKKGLVAVAVALITGVGSFSSFAAEARVDSVCVASDVCQDGFVKAELKDLPAAIAEAVGKSHPGVAIKEAYVAECAEGKQFKVILVVEEKEVVLLLNEKGEEIK